MPVHPQLHFFWTIGFLCATTAVLAVVRTRMLKRRLTFGGIGFLLAAALHLGDRARAGTHRPRVLLTEQGPAIEYMLIAFGAIAVFVALALNPWRQERVGGGVPAIVQDALVAGLSFVAALFLFQNSSFLVGVTGSAIVFGLALQDTLGNAFAGLALQVERPFSVGHWVTVADHEGRVVEVTWRATKIMTKAGNLVVLPNSEIAKAAITNYSQPTAPTRLSVDVGAGYQTPPNDTCDAIMVALRRVGRVMSDPAPDVLLVDFGASSLNYRARFWADDFERVETIMSDVRTAIYYEFGRRGIEIPFPMQVQYSREEVPADSPESREQTLRMIAAVPVFGDLPVEAQRALAHAAQGRLFADGEVIVREGDAGETMYVVKRGRVVVTVGPDSRQVAATVAGGYFGEMSLLTGQPRTATVTAAGDCLLLEIAALDFRSYVQSHPNVIDHLAGAAAARQLELDAARSLAPTVSHAERQSLAQRMREFFGLE